MKYLHLMLGCWALSSGLAFGQNDFPLVSAQECRPRAGLPHFLAKAQTPGSEVRIAYLGGSITAQPGWRPKSLAYFQSRFPQVKFSEINAAIGGTGSDLGVFRLKQDVLDHQPDLLFVEFAVNDGGAAPEQILRCMEGIVRQTWRTLPKCDICFVYTLTEALSKPMLEGKFQRSVSVMEKIADYYEIPTIHLAMEVTKLAKEDKLLWKAPLPKSDEEKQSLGNKVVFAPDGVHPHVQTGHEMYLQAIMRSFDPIKSASKNVGPHVLSSPYFESNYEQAQLLPISEAVLSKGFRMLDAKKDDFGKRWATRMTSLHKASETGETITFKFKGTRVAIYDIIGPDCGQVSVTIDEKPVKVVPRFDSYCIYFRLSTLLIATELPNEVHSVKIEIHPEEPDRAKILAQRHEKMDNPARFQGKSFYPGALLLVGELVK